MLLAIDVRNSGLVAGLYDGGSWASIVRLGVDRSADELGMFLESSARRAGPGSGAVVDEAWVSSVVPALTPRLSSAIASSFGIDALVVGPGTKTGLKIRTDTPSELGSDIVCSAVAARDRVDGAAIVVDFGSALVVSAINGLGELLGVSIAPGVDSAAHALRATTAQIPEVRLEYPRRAIGKNTAQAVQSGILIGYGGLVQRIVAAMAAEMDESARILGTGDDSGRSILASVGYEEFVPNLALEGLALISARNKRS
ncbi:MAG: type III pantothenate kinase [Spirochaetales bacterium]|nr:type III pantothenate kinase [Spirochaetales bacterium]